MPTGEIVAGLTLAGGAVLWLLKLESRITGLEKTQAGNAEHLDELSKKIDRLTEKVAELVGELRARQP